MPKKQASKVSKVIGISQLRVMNRDDLAQLTGPVAVSCRADVDVDPIAVIMPWGAYQEWIARERMWRHRERLDRRYGRKSSKTNRHEKVSEVDESSTTYVVPKVWDERDRNWK